MRLNLLTGAITDEQLKENKLSDINIYQTYALSNGQPKEHVVEFWFEKKSVVFWMMATTANFDQSYIEDSELLRRSKNLAVSIYEKV